MAELNLKKKAESCLQLMVMLFSRQEPMLMFSYQFPHIHTIDNRGFYVEAVQAHVLPLLCECDGL